MKPIHDTVDHNLAHVPPSVLSTLALRPGADQPLSAFAPVIALTATRGAPSCRQVLVCVRDPDDNVTHPNVLSSATMRLGDPSVVRLAIDEQWDAPRLAEALRSPVVALLSTKLGLGSSASATVAVRRAAVWQGDSVIGMSGGDPVVEHLTMINVHVELPDDLELPSHTYSYSSIQWVTVEEHRAIVDSGDATCTGLQFNGDSPIVYGLCTRSTASMLDLVCQLDAARCRAVAA